MTATEIHYCPVVAPGEPNEHGCPLLPSTSPQWTKGIGTRRFAYINGHKITETMTGLYLVELLDERGQLLEVAGVFDNEGSAINRAAAS